MPNEEIGKLNVVVNLDSTGFQNGISSLNRQMKLVQSEFQAATAKIGDFGSSTDGLKLKSDALTKQIEIQKQKVAALEAAYQKSAATKGTDAKATQDLAIKLNKAQTELAKIENELKKTTIELDKQSSVWYRVSQSAQQAGEKFKSVGDRLKDVGSNLSMTLTAPILAAGAASVKLASDLNESLNKVDVAFKNNAKEVETWSNTTLKSYGIAKGTALDMAAGFGDMATSMGFNTKQAAEMSTKLVGLAGDLASFKNISIDVAKTALTSVFTGETESLKQLGVVMTEANLQEYALSQGIQKRVRDMSEAEKVQLRYNFVLEKTKNAHGDFERTGAGTANQMRIFQESLKQLGETLGQKLLPIITPIITKLNDWIQKFSNLDGKSQKIILVLGGIIAAIGPVLLILGQLSIAIGAISLPVVIVTGVIAGLIAIGILLYKNWDDIKAKISAIWNGIKSSAESIFNSIKNFFKNVWNDISNTASSVWNGIKNTASSIWNGLVNIASNTFERIKFVITHPIEAAKNTFHNIINTIKDLFSFNLSFPRIQIPHIPLPHFNISGKFSLNPPSIPRINVDWYAKGGIFTGPSIIGVGEAGPEAVIPIDKLSNIIRDAINHSGSSGDIIIQNMQVRNDQDIQLMARELFNLQQRAARARGLA